MVYQQCLKSSEAGLHTLSRFIWRDEMMFDLQEESLEYFSGYFSGIFFGAGFVCGCGLEKTGELKLRLIVCCEVENAMPIMLCDIKRILQLTIDNRSLKAVSL